ncbi:helix-turn-helix domain-containing protein [Neobacillus bataviensis]|uniref:helix-turn-helix domain-containing protein n=1 Tax=Neobacillus bataviensis TaxID=220685 RepID=UPI0028F715D8|nr:helix-turn-helix domain-containing protein [Neobacillus bataviensis]
MLSATHLSEILTISKPTAYKVMDSTDFPLIKIGGCKRVYREEFDKWLEQQKMTTT